jgi:pyrimidine deaminase RibD-like protein
METAIPNHAQHLKHLRFALSLARKSPPKPTNYCVGAILVDASLEKVISTGYTLELPGNTHAEQCCLAKLATSHGVTEGQLGNLIPVGAILYTTMEPCVERLSGNTPCVQRIIGTKVDDVSRIKTVICGVQEPETFVKENNGRKLLQDAGIEVLYVTDLQEDILEVAKAGHEKK